MDGRRPPYGSRRPRRPMRSTAALRTAPRMDESPRSRTGLLFGMALATGLLVFGLSMRADAGETHYLKARQMVANEERGMVPEMINYDLPVYQEALAELSLVEHDSKYFERAAEFASEIRANIEAYHDRLKAEAASRRAIAEALRRRQEEFEANVRRDRMMVQTEFPECENEGQHRD